MVWPELWGMDRTETRVKILMTAEDWKKVLRLPDPYEKMMDPESAVSPLPEYR